MSSPKLQTRGLSKVYRDTVALRPTDLSVPAGEFLTLLGPSGSGKTTLLQLVCGLVEPTGGAVLIDGRDETRTPASRRNLGVVFQNYALFPHMTVAENVAFPLEMRRVGPAETSRRAAGALDLVGLGALAHRFPSELSGGQQQRVALARCFVYEPALILMDEPLGALDRKLRDSLQGEIRRLHRQTGATIVFVTHDQEEALALSDRICLMRDGAVEQIGTPRAIYDDPASLFAAEFVGLSNILRGRAGPGGEMLHTPDGPVPVPGGSRPLGAGEEAAIMVRPEHLGLREPGTAGALPGTIFDSVYAGSELRLSVLLPSGATLTVRRPANEPGPAPGAPVSITWDPASGRLLRPDPPDPKVAA